MFYTLPRGTLVYPVLGRIFVPLEFEGVTCLSLSLFALDLNKLGTSMFCYVNNCDYVVFKLFLYLADIGGLVWSTTA